MSLKLVHSDTENTGRPLVARVELSGLTMSGRVILGSLDLSLFKGETVALTGPSGVGKTTLLRTIAGLENSHSGMVKTPSNTAMVFQEPTLLKWRTLADNLMIPLKISQEKAEHALASVGLAGRGADFPTQLSLGQQRRLSLARAFAAEPDLMLLDEPFVSLDDALADEMMGLFETLKAGSDITTLIVTHSEREARRLASRVLVLSGSPAVLKS